MSADELQKYSGIAPVTNAAARSVGYTGCGSARSLSGKPLWNGPHRPLTNPSGLASTIDSSATRAAPTKQRYGRWPSSGSAFFIAAGKRARLTTNQPISTRCGGAAHPCSNSFIQLRKTLDGLPQGVKRSSSLTKSGLSRTKLDALNGRSAFMLTRWSGNH